MSLFLVTLHESFRIVFFMRIQIYPFLLFCLAFFACTHEGDEPLSKTHPTTIDEDEDATTAVVNDQYVYKLPIIFHVLYQDANDATQYVSAARLEAIVKNVNELYQGGIYGESENIGVQFVLAKYDENGKKLVTPGVEYVKYSDAYPIDADTFMNDNSGKNVKYIWDPNEYINVMVYHFKNEEDLQTLGVSHLPFVLKSDSTIAGLESVSRKDITKKNLKYAYCSSINSVYIDSESTRYIMNNKKQGTYQYTSTDINVTLAHELGHYLGLYHPFSETKKDGGYQPSDDCHDSDYCTDTPSYNKIAYDSWMKQYLHNRKDTSIDIRELVTRQNCEAHTFQSDNLMDYAISYSFAFSAEQKHRIRQVLYYSPLMPGPKKNRKTTRTTVQQDDEMIDLPIRIMK